MMTATPAPPATTCPECAAPLPCGAPAGRCPRCMLRLTLAEDALAPGPLRQVLRGGEFAGREAQARFRTEAAAVAQLQHPVIVAIHDVGEADGVLWFSMDLVPGENLADHTRENPFPARAAAECVRRVAEAVQHAHENGVLHRDLKPSNILLDGDGQPRVTDFGLARRTSADTPDLTRTGELLGSPGYAAPEQALGGKADARTDVYGLGAVLYHLLTSRPPFQGPTLDSIVLQLRETDPLPPRRLNPDVPRDLETICLKCLDKTHAHRFGVRFLQFTPDGTHLVLGKGNGSIAVVSCPDGAERHTVICDLASGRTTTLPACTILLDAPEVSAAAEWSPDARPLLICDRGWHYDAATARPVAAWPDYDHGGGMLAILAIAWQPRSGEIAMGRETGDLEIRSAADGRILRQRSLHWAKLRAIAWHPAERRLASASSDGMVKVLVADTLEELLVFPGSQRDVRALAWSPDGRTLASGAADGTILLRDSERGEP